MNSSTRPDHTLWTLANSYREAGDAAHNLGTSRSSRSFDPAPDVFLYFRSIELSLVSALLFQGVPTREIKAIGHSLKGLCDRLATFMQLSAIGITDTARTEIIDAHSYDYEEKWFENGQSPEVFRDLEKLRYLAWRICESMRPLGIPYRTAHSFHRAAEIPELHQAVAHHEEYETAIRFCA